MINESRLIQTLCELIRIDSPSGEEQAVAFRLTEMLENLGLDVGLDHYGNVIASLGDKDPFLLSAHMDTVEPGRGIEPKVNGDKVVSGDFTILGGDCKAGIAAILEGLTSVIEETGSIKPFEIAFTRQEEIGLIGAQNLDFSRLKSREAVVFDGEGPATQITSSSPTHVRLDIEVTGRSAHAGVEPENGLSAIQIAAELITRLPQGRLDEETTFNLGVIKGGSVTNAVPEKVTLMGEFRSHDASRLADLRLVISNAIDEVRGMYPDSVIDLNLNTQFQAFSVLEGDSCIDRVIDALGKLNLKHTMVPSGGGTDGNVFRLHGIAAAVIGMADHNAHTTREYVSIPQLVDAARLCEALLKA